MRYDYVHNVYVYNRILLFSLVCLIPGGYSVEEGKRMRVNIAKKLHCSYDL